MDRGGLGGGDYHSEFDSDAESLSGKAKRKRRDEDFSKNPDVPHLNSGHISIYRPYKAHHSRAFQEYDAYERQKQRSQFLSLSAFDRHKKLVNDYLLYYGGSKKELTRDSRFDKTDLDVVRENIQFIYDEEDGDKAEDGTTAEPSDWGQRIAKRYWDKLFKEYAIADLTYFKTGQIGMRWRTQTEVVNGKGQFQCANKYCQEKDDLQSWEVNFAYKEKDTKKNALVKLRLCPECSMKLNYKKQHKPSKPVRKLKDMKKKKKKSSKDHKKHSSKKERKKKKAGKRSRSSSNSGSEDSQSESEESSKDARRSDVIKDNAQESASSVWKEPVQVQNNDEDKAIEVEIDDYFADMLA